MAAVVQQSTLIGDGSGATNPISRTLPNVTAGNTLVAICWGYAGTFGSSASGKGISDDVNGGWGTPEFDANVRNCALAIYYKANAAAGTTTITLTPDSATYHMLVVLELDLTGTIHAAHVSADGDSTTTSAGPVTPVDANNIAVCAFAHGIANYTIDADTGWTLIAKQEDYFGAYQPGGCEYKAQASATAITGTWPTHTQHQWHAVTVVLSSGAGAAALAGGGSPSPSGSGDLTTGKPLAGGGAATPSGAGTMQGDTTLVGSGAATPTGSASLSTGVSLAGGGSAVPSGTGDLGATRIFYTSNIVDNQQSSSLNFGPNVPQVGDQITVLVSLFAMDPTVAMVSDNNGHVYVRDKLQSYTALGGDGMQAGLAVFRTTVTTNSATPFTITFDSGVATPGDIPGRWWTWGIVCHSRAASSPVDDSSVSQGVNSTTVEGGTSTATTDYSLAFFVAFNRGHDTRPVILPTGWTVVMNNSEDSQHQSGHGCFKVLTAPGDVTPVANVIDSATGEPSEVTQYSGLVIIYKLQGISMAGGSAPTPSGAGALTTSIAFTGGNSPSVTGSGALTTAIRCAGGGTASPTGAGDLTTAVALAGGGGPTPQGYATFAGDTALVGTGGGVPAGAGDLSTAIPLAGGGSAAPVLAGALVTGLPLLGGGGAAPAGAGALTTGIALTGGGAAVPTGGAAFVLALTGSGTAVPEGSASLTTGKPLAGGASAAPTGDGQLSTAIPLMGGGAAQVGGSGNLSVGGPVFPSPKHVFVVPTKNRTTIFKA